MASIENNAKKYITSLLTSTPLVVTMQQLSKDYRDTIGEPIPYQKLGYNSLEHFLRSITDTVVLRGSGPTAAVLPVISQKSAHVYCLVSNQKVTRPRRRQYGGQQRRVSGYVPPRKPLIPFHVNTRPPPPPLMKRMYYPPENDTSASASGSNESCEYVTFNNKTQTGESYTKYTQAIGPSKTSVPNGNCRSESVVKASAPVVNKKLEDPPKVENTQLLQEKKQENVSKKCTNVRNLLKKLTPDKNKISTEQLEKNVPYHIRNNLRSLINQCPEGIWCGDVPEKYRKMFRQELCYQELGFRSLIDLCVCLSSIFHYVRPSTEDFKLYDRSRPLPDCAETKFTVASYSVNTCKNLDSDADALPNLDWADVEMFLPKGIFRPGQEIPRAFIPREVADYDVDFDVVVGEIYDLSKFWIYLQDTLLDHLMDNMQDFYKDHALEYEIPDHLIREGLYCAQIIFGEYHRALIVDVMPEVKDTIRMIFIDYGTMTKVPMKGLCFLHEDFASLPAQAIRCRLANIVPLEEGIPWSREASKSFRKMVANRDMSMKISHIHWEDQFLEIYLADVTDSNNIFYINDRLVEEGFALYPEQEREQSLVDPIYTSIVKFIHLFPTFLELEHGLAPSTFEMEILYDCDVPINFCYPQYFYVDHSCEENIIKAAEDFHEKNCLKGKQRTPGRYYDLDQFKSDLPDMSFFGELEAEIMAFLTEPVKQPSVPSSDEDFVDADEDFYDKLDIMTEKFKNLSTSTKDEETANALKEDLFMSETIMNDICKSESETYLPPESQNDTVQSEHDEFESSSESHSGTVQSEHDEFEYNYGLPEPERELWTIEEARESAESVAGYKYETDKSDESLDYNQMFYSNHPLSNLSFGKGCSTEGDGSSSNSPTSEHRKGTEYDLQEPDVWLKPINFSFLSESNTNLDYILPSKETPTCEPSNIYVQDDTNIYQSSKDLESDILSSCTVSSNDLRDKGIVSTNPFHEDLTAPSGIATDLPAGVKLNPNNPFLTFLSCNSNRETSSESSRASSTSTTYESPIVQANTTHSWSNFDDMSPETISQLGKTLSTKSNSSDSVIVLDDGNKCSIATQTLNEQNKMPPPVQNNPYPYFCPPAMLPYGYPNWSPNCANPYYNVRYGNYPSYPCEPYYGTMQPYRPPVPPGFGPPPGFGAMSNSMAPPYTNHPRLQQGPLYHPAMQAPRALPYYGAGAPPKQDSAVQFNGMSKTVDVAVRSVSVSVVSDSKDFYDLYNDRLKLGDAGQ